MRNMSLLGTSAIAAALIAFAAAGPAAAQADRSGAGAAPPSGTVSGPGTMGPYGMGPGMMYGYGMHPGMMGPGMMSGYGMGPGMMYGRGAGANPAMGGSGYVIPTLDLNTDDVKGFFERWIARSGNSHIKLGKVTEKDANTIEVEIVTQDNSLVEKYEVSRDTGFFHPA